MASEPEPNRNARFKLLVHEDPENDTLMLYVDYRSVHVRMSWRDSQRQDVVELLAQGTWFLDKGHIEHEIQRESASLDKDLDTLFEDGEDQ